MKRLTPPKYSFNEIKKVNNIRFNTVDLSDVGVKAQLLAQSVYKMEKRLLNCEDDKQYEDLIKKAAELEYLNENWEPEVIQSYLNRLTPQDCIAIVMDKNQRVEGKMKVEPIYGIEYRVEPFGDTLMSTLQEAKPLPGETLGFTPENIYIPDWPLQSNRLQSTGTPSFPALIAKDVWFK